MLSFKRDIAPDHSVRYVEGTASHEPRSVEKALAGLQEAAASIKVIMKLGFMEAYPGSRLNADTKRKPTETLRERQVERPNGARNDLNERTKLGTSRTYVKHTIGVTPNVNNVLRNDAININRIVNDPRSNLQWTSEHGAVQIDVAEMLATESKAPAETDLREAQDVLVHALAEICDLGELTTLETRTPGGRGKIHPAKIAPPGREVFRKCRVERRNVLG